MFAPSCDYPDSSDCSSSHPVGLGVWRAWKVCGWSARSAAGIYVQLAPLVGQVHGCCMVGKYQSFTTGYSQQASGGGCRLSSCVVAFSSLQASNKVLWELLCATSMLLRAHGALLTLQNCIRVYLCAHAADSVVRLRPAMQDLHVHVQSMY